MSRWSEVLDKIKKSIETPELEDKNGKVIFDSQLGIVGRKGKRGQDDAVKILGRQGVRWLSTLVMTGRVT